MTTGEPEGFDDPRVAVLWTDVIPQSTFALVEDLIPDRFDLRSVAAADQAPIEVAHADYLLASGPVRIDHALLERAVRLRAVQKLGSGIDTVDVDALVQRGLPAFNTAGANAVGVAEHVVALILSVLRFLPRLDHRLRTEGRFDKWTFRDRSRELAGMQVGLIGFGHVGRAAARRLSTFDVDLVCHTRTGLTPQEEERLGVRAVGLDELLESSDVISISLPLTAETRHLLDERRLAQVRPGSYLVNTSRGGVVAEAAVLEALRDGRLAGFATDVFEREPPPADHPLYALENVVVTPHAAGATVESFRRVFSTAMENLRLLADGGQPPAALRLTPPTEP
jgi:phosphoglycerate dehydrogenase-like enzyme